MSAIIATFRNGIEYVAESVNTERAIKLVLKRHHIDFGGTDRDSPRLAVQLTVPVPAVDQQAVIDEIKARPDCPTSVTLRFKD